jgi:hypothetical protein
MFDTREDLKRSIIALLLRLQASDTNKHIREFAYIHKVATHLGLSAEDVRDVENSLDHYPLRPPAGEKERMTILYYLLFLMEIDGEVTPEEEDVVKEFGLRLGFRMGLTSELIAVVKHYAKTQIPPDALLERIKKYLN